MNHRLIQRLFRSVDGATCVVYHRLGLGRFGLSVVHVLPGHCVAREKRDETIDVHSGIR
jgi:hypothetical protein